MKQPLAISITDTHLSENTIDVNLSVFKQVFTACANLGVATILHQGDIFTSRKGQTEIVLNTFKDILDQAALFDLKILAIPGNHDKTCGDSHKSFLDAFDGHCAFTTLDVGAALMHDNVNIYFMPYYDLSYISKMEELNKTIDEKANNILITHVAIDGVRNNSGIIVEGEIAPTLFGKFNKVLVGHYHDQQILGDNGFIIYIGSAYQANFGEDVNKGYTIIFDDGSLEFVRLQFPEYITLDILPQDLTADVVRMVSEKSKEARVRVRFDSEITEDKKALVAQLQQYGTKVEVERQAFDPIENVQEKVVLTSIDILESYCEWGVERKIENIDFGKQRLIKVL